MGLDKFDCHKILELQITAMEQSLLSDYNIISYNHTKTKEKMQLFISQRRA